MSNEQIENTEQTDPRIEEILTHYDPEAREEALKTWKEYSEEEKKDLFERFKKDHEKAA